MGRKQMKKLQLLRSTYTSYINRQLNTQENDLDYNWDFSFLKHTDFKTANLSDFQLFEKSDDPESRSLST